MKGRISPPSFWIVSFSAALAMLVFSSLFGANVAEAATKKRVTPKCPNNNGQLLALLEPVSEVQINQPFTSRITVQAACKRKKPKSYTQSEVSKLIGKQWGLACEAPTGKQSVLVKFKGRKVSFPTGLTIPGDWACQVVPDGKGACSSQNFVASNGRVCGTLKRQLKKLGLRGVQSRAIVFRITDPTGQSGTVVPSATSPTAPVFCADLCRASTAPSNASASLVIGRGLRLNQCDTQFFGFALQGATRRSGDQAFICLNHPVVNEFYEVNLRQEPGAFTLTYPGAWEFFAVVFTDKGVVCTPSVGITVADEGFASCASPLLN